MPAIHKPSQNLSFYYNSAEKRLYVKSMITVSVGKRETLFLNNQTSMDKEASISHEIKATDQTAKTQFKESIRILLIENVELPDNNKAENLRKIIREDQRRKGITEYKVHSKVTSPDEQQVGLDTTTISADGIIEID